MSGRSRLSSFLRPAAPSGSACVHSAESQLLWGTVGTLGSAPQPASRSSIYPARPALSLSFFLQGVMGRFPLPCLSSLCGAAEAPAAAGGIHPGALSSCRVETDDRAAAAAAAALLVVF